MHRLKSFFRRIKSVEPGYILGYPQSDTASSLFLKPDFTLALGIHKIYKILVIKSLLVKLTQVGLQLATKMILKRIMRLCRGLKRPLFCV